MPETTALAVLDSWINTRSNILRDAGSKPSPAAYQRFADFHNSKARELCRVLGIDTAERASALSELAVQLALTF